MHDTIHIVNFMQKISNTICRNSKEYPIMTASIKLFFSIVMILAQFQKMRIELNDNTFYHQTVHSVKVC